MNIETSNPERLVIPICDLEAQKLFKISPQDIYTHIKYAHLLSSNIVISPSFLFESNDTLKFYKKNIEFLREKNVLISMKEDHILEFIEKKQFTYFSLKENYPGYFQPIISIQVLDKAQPLKRKSQMVLSIQDIWNNQLDSDSPMSLKRELLSIMNEKDAYELIIELLSIPKKLENLPFTWEVLEIFLINYIKKLSYENKLIIKLKNILRYRLLSFYFQSLANLTNSFIVTFNDYGSPRLDENMDSSKMVSVFVFSRVLQILGIKSIINKLKDYQILEEKYRPEFRAFLGSYFNLLRECASQNIFFDSIYDELKNEKKILSEHILMILEKGKLNGERNLLKVIDDVLSQGKGYIPSQIYDHAHLTQILDQIPFLKFKDIILERYGEIQKDYSKKLQSDIHKALSLLQPINKQKNREPMSMLAKKNIFISYSHEDKVLMEQLSEHLQTLQNVGLVELWNDKLIKGGDEWLVQIETAMKKCDIAIFLVSKSFLNSKFCQDVEMPKLIDRYYKEGVRIIPIIIRSSNWKIYPLISKFQVWPEDGRPVARFRGDNRDKILVEICQNIMQL